LLRVSRLQFVQRRWDSTPRQDESGRTVYSYTMHERDLASADVTTNAQGEASYDYAITEPGSINIKTIVKDGKKTIPIERGLSLGRGQKGEWSDWAYGDEQSIKLVADKKTYQAGENRSRAGDAADGQGPFCW